MELADWKPSTRQCTNFRFAFFIQLSIGITILSLGILIYILDRGPKSLSFLTIFDAFPLDNYDTLKPLVPFSKSLPSLIHACSFSILTCAFFPSKKKKPIFSICFIWTLTNIIFEFGQMLSISKFSWAVDNRADFFLFNQINRFFSYGTFDWDDIFYSIVGGLIAYLFLSKTSKGYSNEK